MAMGREKVEQDWCQDAALHNPNIYLEGLQLESSHGNLNIPLCSAKPWVFVLLSALLKLLPQDKGQVSG